MWPLTYGSVWNHLQTVMYMSIPFVIHRLTSSLLNRNCWAFQTGIQPDRSSESVQQYPRRRQMCSAASLPFPSWSPRPLSIVSKALAAACAATQAAPEIRTVLHELRHAKDHDHRNKTHQDHWVLENAHNAESTSGLVELLLRGGANVNLQLALRRAQVGTLVAPFIATECLPYMYDLFRGLVFGVADVDTVGWEKVIAGVDCEQIAGLW